MCSAGAHFWGCCRGCGQRPCPLWAQGWAGGSRDQRESVLSWPLVQKFLIDSKRGADSQHCEPVHVSFFLSSFFPCHLSTGKFGACFIPVLCKQSDLTLYASRPGLRLWKADIHGTVQATFILKDVFAGGVKPFELYPRLDSAARGGCSSPEKHLGLVSCFFQEGWVLSWNEYSIYLLDTVNQVSQVMVA